MLECCAGQTPSLAPLALAMYREPAQLLVTLPDGTSDASITSREGSQQGDPIGGILFGLSFKGFLADAKAKLAELMTTHGYSEQVPFLGAIWDDSMGVMPKDVAAAFMWWVQTTGFPAVHLRMKPSASWVWSPVPLSDAEKEAFPPDIHFAPPEKGMVWAGAPYGTDAYIVDTVQETITEHLHIVSDKTSPWHKLYKQQAFLSLTFCVQARPSDLIRMLPARLIGAAIARFDDAMLKAIIELLQLPIERLEHDFVACGQVGLPTRMGGFGVRPKADILQEAYLSAFLGSTAVIQARWPHLGAIVCNIGAATAAVAALPTVQDVRHAYAHVRDAEDSEAAAPQLQPRNGGALEKVLPNGLVDLPTAPGSFAGLQHKLTAACDTRTRVGLLADPRTTLDQKAFLLSCGGPMGGAYLRGLPGIIPACKMTDHQF
jgi:hypothetical protein